MKNNVLLLVATSMLFASCLTPKQAAQRHLRKAILLDPTVVSRQYTDTTITGVAEGTVKVSVPGDSGRFDLDCDSLINALHIANMKNEKAVYIYQDTLLSLSVSKSESGKMAVKYDIKPKNIYVPVKVPYKVEVRVPGKQINIPVDRPFYVYKWFWILLAISLLTTYLWLSSTGIAQSFINKLRK